MLEDTNNDGKMDKKTVFLDRLVLPRALKVLDKGVLVAEPPHLWLARDTNGDLKADSKELVCDCYGTELANVEHNQNGLLWAMDNWMHTSEGDTYFRLEGRQDRDPEDAVARAVGRDAGRLRPRLSQLEQLGAAYRFRPDAVLPAQPEPGAHPWQLRVHGRPGRTERHVSGAAEPRRQSRLLRLASCAPTARSRPTPA